MSSSPFNDFAALKALKKDLEKAAAPAGQGGGSGSNMPNQPRKKTVTLKTRNEMLDAQKQRESGLLPGMKVTLMDSNDRGVIKHVRKDCVEIELDYGFIVPVGFHDFVVNDAEEDRKLRQSVSTSRKKDDIDDEPTFTGKASEIDLHIEALPGGLGIPKSQALPYQLEYFRKTLRSQLKHRGSRIIFVHGVGDGILKAAIREDLDTVYAISCTWLPYGDGATAVTIR